MSVPVTPSLSTYAQIEKKVRRLTASSSSSSLTSSDIGEYVNTYYENDFPYGVKMDQMRSVYTFFTEPYRDRYPIDVNFNQGIRAPMYVEGIQGTFTKDRQQFYQVWPRFPTISHPINGDGMTVTFPFNVPGPFLSHEVVLGGVAVDGNPISVNDDGQGNLVLKVPNQQTSVPAVNSNPAIPGMYNQNLGNPGLIQPTIIGSVDYVTGNMTVTFPAGFIPAAGTQMTCWVSQYQPGRPYSMLLWNNELIIRPVPKLIHKFEIETYLTPVQFLNSTDSPILNQWWQLIAIGAAIKILEDRQDMEGIENMAVLYDRQEALALERQSVEEIFQPNITIFNSSQQNVGYGGGISGSAGWW